MRNYRPTWAEIKLEAVKYNLNEIRTFLDKDVAIMPVVKANAYGHGISEVSRVFVSNGIEYLGVATVDEALKLRGDGLMVSILVMGSVLEDEARAAVQKDITLTLCDPRLLQILIKIAKETGRSLRVHVKVDTGMGRIGVWHENAARFIKQVANTECIELEGVYTHFSSAARDKMYTSFQIEFFENVLEDLGDAGIDIKYRHAANSIAVVDWKISHMNLVRPGVVLYGIYPKEDFRRVLKLRPVMSLKTRIVYLKNTPSGRAISYGRTYITQKDTVIATIPIGYADGYGRILSNRAEALVKGQLVKVAGIVTMDQTLLDVGHVADVQVGDEVVLIGEQKGMEISVEKVAKLARTIPYEILAGITDRVPRIYKN